MKEYLKRIPKQLILPIGQVLQPVLLRRRAILAIPPFILRQHERSKYLGENKADGKADDRGTEPWVVAGGIVAVVFTKHVRVAQEQKVFGCMWSIKPGRLTHQR